MKILIILTGALGDISRALPLAKELKKIYPNSELTWLVYKKWEPIVKLNIFVDKTIIFEKNLLGFFKTITKINSKFDLVLDLQRNLRSGLFSFLTFANRRICFNKRNSREINSIFNTEQIAFFPEEESKLFHYLEFIKYLKGEPEINFGLNTNNLTNIINDKYILLVLGSTWSSKNWIDSEYKKLVAIFKDYKIVLAGTSDMMKLAISLESENVFNLVGKTNLVELASLIYFSSVIVSPDSGPAHLASALGKKVITLLGATAGNRVVPYGSEKLTLFKEIECLGCFKKVCPRGDKLCMQLIKAEDVADKIFEVL